MVSAEIAVFARLPAAGKVKTRLAAGVGIEQAAYFYKACAEHIFSETARYVVTSSKTANFRAYQLSHLLAPQVHNSPIPGALLCRQ